MRIALVQQHATSDLTGNLSRALAATRRAAEQGAELVAFAELALTPFYPRRPAEGDVRALAEPIPGPTTDTFSALAQRAQHRHHPEPVRARRRGRPTTRSPVIDAGGALLGRTRMVHITEYPCFHEQQYYTPGNLGAPVFETRVGRVGVAICYDRHFPEYMRALGVAGAELVVVPQAGLVDEWAGGFFEAELCVPAFQNGYFVALCNRVGVEAPLTFAGESFVCGPEGAVRARAPRGEDAILIADIDLADVAKSHARRTLLKDSGQNSTETGSSKERRRFVRFQSGSAGHVPNL